MKYIVPENQLQCDILQLPAHPVSRQSDQATAC